MTGGITRTMKSRFSEGEVSTICCHVGNVTGASDLTVGVWALAAVTHPSANITAATIDLMQFPNDSI